MASKADQERKEAKRQAVVSQMNAMHSSLEMLSGMWDERALDLMMLALGIGEVKITKE